MDLDKWMYPPVTSRIKILADLDIAEKRTPQDGRIRFAGREGEFDFRVSTLPTHYGEKSVLRILKHDPKLLEVCNLGIQGREQQTLLSAIEKPQGMIFVTGPTGSGKTSTLFACLNKIRHKDINITTIENPIEYKLENINQVQINEKAGITFASALRSILRQDPDVILVGEIRDRETAEIAIQASQTGHLVLSTLHTNDAVSAITRLRDLGIPSFMISSALLAIIAQRLVRILCPACRREEQLEGEVYERWLRLIGEQFPDRIYTAQGCPRCSNTGFLGRTGIFETVGANDRLRSLLSDEINESRLKQQLQQQGMRTMIYNGIGKIEQGITTPQELLRVVMAEELTA
jgi:type II secretory ATPase GspE/PulE/Tfp pilus assembly ATPase PilB-like protein